jgi:alcohol dehydrogenase
MIEGGLLRPERLIGGRISLAGAIGALTGMDRFEAGGVTVIDRFV